MVESSPVDVSEALVIEGLTIRETQVCRLVAMGETCPAIAAKLDISVRTVEAHVHNAARHIPGAGHPMKRIIRAWAAGGTDGLHEPAGG